MGWRGIEPRGFVVGLFIELRSLLVLVLLSLIKIMRSAQFISTDDV